MTNENDKVWVKLHPLFKRDKARDVVSGVMFSQDAVEIGESDWNRLKEKNWYLNGDSYPLLIEADSESSAEDNETDDAPWEADNENAYEDESVLQDSISEEE